MRQLAFPLILAATTALAGCGGTINRGVESVHQPVVTRANYVFDASVDDGHLAATEAERLRIWLDAVHLSYGDRVSIDDPAGFSAAAGHDVAAIVGRYGLAVSAGAPVTDGVVPAGAVRVVVSRTTASVPGCPDFSRPSQPDFGSNTLSNFGCATNATFAAMVANPEDLIHGQTGSATVDAATSTKAIKSFRTKALSGEGGLKSESTGGK